MSTPPTPTLPEQEEDEVDKAAAFKSRQPYVIAHSYWDRNSTVHANYAPSPEELAALASRTFGGILLYQRNSPQPGTTIEPPFAEVSRQAVWAALAIVQTIREGGSLNAHLERVLSVRGKAEQAEYEKELEQFVAKEWQPVLAAHRRRHGLPQDAVIDRVDLRAYLEAIIPKVRRGDSARQERFVAFFQKKHQDSVQPEVERYREYLALFEKGERDVAASRAKDPKGAYGHSSENKRPKWNSQWDIPSGDTIISRFSEGVDASWAFEWHSAFVEFVRSWKHHRLQEAGRKGGKARHGKRSVGP